MRQNENTQNDRNELSAPLKRVSIYSIQSVIKLILLESYTHTDINSIRKSKVHIH